MIPIKGYATFDPLKHCMIGSAFKYEWFKDLFKNQKILDPLKRIAEETEQDYQALESILKKAGVKTYRAELDINKYSSLADIKKPPISPRDDFAVIGEKIYAVPGDSSKGYANILKQIPKENIQLEISQGVITTCLITRVGKDIFWGVPENHKILEDKYKKIWEDQGFRVHCSYTNYHHDGAYCVVKPGAIVSLYDVQNYKKLFPNWDILYLPDQSWSKVSPFLKIKDKVGGKWWLKGEEDNDQLINFVNTWLDDWVGYVEETVFDVNMLSIDKDTIICNNYNKEVFDFFKKHKVEPIIFNFRHRYFWDGGVHCITQDLYREGTQEDYFG